ncbi:CHAP domain-containing protein [Phycicoccus sonneratiae]|uniref:CHAP domain-containing protein n=1 Tax=Phycicoccus sonneratiae TaxID=2807628 RepID=A0ABS2CM51_9MICO|nr:CHAP domain-containing protein [Phycicoccus sonneraticus]MBM6400951.1 CHAP domain-containing protein [Phycicoccus sonneraticus]
MHHRPALALAAASVLTALAAVPALADPLPSTTGLSGLRQATVDRADAALNNPRSFKLAGSNTLHSSTVKKAQNRNVLELSGSNDNRVVYNDYNGNSWCGSFIAAMWTGHTMPDPAAFPRIPTSYESSQAWRTDPRVADRWHPYTGARQALPAPGDVLVWSDDGSSRAGHVGLVVKVTASTRTILTVEGNVDGDEIARKSYTWGTGGPQRAGKTFRGYTSRE